MKSRTAIPSSVRNLLLLPESGLCDTVPQWTVQCTAHSEAHTKAKHAIIHFLTDPDILIHDGFECGPYCTLYQKNKEKTLAQVTKMVKESQFESLPP